MQEEETQSEQGHEEQTQHSEHPAQKIIDSRPRIPGMNNSDVVQYLAEGKGTGDVMEELGIMFRPPRAPSGDPGKEPGEGEG